MSSHLPAIPLAAIISQAAQAPRETGRTARLRARFEHAGNAVVILADTSGSMGGRAGARSKLALLRDALEYAIRGQPAEPILVAFASTPERLPASGLRRREAAGGTALHLAIASVASDRPRRTVVITDGQPDDREAALAAVRDLSGTIDVIYVGPDDDQAAKQFCRDLAGEGAGRMHTHDLVARARLEAEPARALGTTVRALLEAPGGVS